MNELRFHGDSMYPVIKDGDRLTIEMFPVPRPVTQLKIGQIVLLSLGGEWVVHRVVKAGGQITTKGDWALGADEQELAWGFVTAINNRSNKLCQSSLIARLSAVDCHGHSRWLRKTRKVAMVAVVGLFNFLPVRRDYV